jgi:hypothetical protein
MVSNNSEAVDEEDLMLQSRSGMHLVRETTGAPKIHENTP